MAAILPPSGQPVLLPSPIWRGLKISTDRAPSNTTQNSAAIQKPAHGHVQYGNIDRNFQHVIKLRIEDVIRFVIIDC